ncbi:MAG: type IX secretion system membrane protein PorP/SprF [Bacteroidota bacterium]|nr:type IX secretion system membrane protein PorP/SprF [Bacteroidota bacterium]
MNFTKNLVVMFSILAVCKIYAQGDPTYSQFMFNKLTFNPGTAGATDGKICATLMNHKQSFGFGNKLFDSLYGRYIGVPPSNLALFINTALGKDSTKFLSRIGTGFSFFKNEIGFETTTQAKLAVSYMHPFGNKNTLAFGIGIGMIQKSLDATKINLMGTGLQYPAEVNGEALDIDLGLFYSKRDLTKRFTRFNAGISVTHFNESKITYELPGALYGRTIIENKKHFYLTMGAEFQLPVSSLKLQPNILMITSPYKFRSDLNCSLIWKERIRGGLSWRPMEAIVVMGGYQFPKFGRSSFYMGYSYDFVISKTVKYNSGSQEIVLRYCLSF